MNVSIHRCKVIICCVVLAIGIATTIIYIGQKKGKTIENQIARPIVKTPPQKISEQSHSYKDMKYIQPTIKETYSAGEIDLPIPDLNMPPIDHLSSLRKWASLNYFSTEPNQLNVNELEKKVKNIPVEIFTEDITKKDIHFARDLVKRFVLCYSGGSFSDWLELRGNLSLIHI